MQVMFFHQHFGQFALGMTSFSETVRRHRKLLESKNAGDKFFQITRGGLSIHPWEHNDEHVIRVAIVGDGLIDNLDAEPCLYALCRRESTSTHSWLEHHFDEEEKLTALPSPQILVEDVLWNAGVVKSEPKRDWWQWEQGKTTWDTPPTKYRRLLEKVMARLDSSFEQGPDFFTKNLFTRGHS